jgi:hypothetical protein
MFCKGKKQASKIKEEKKSQCKPFWGTREGLP